MPFLSSSSLAFFSSSAFFLSSAAFFFFSSSAVFLSSSSFFFLSASSFFFSSVSLLRSASSAFFFSMSSLFLSSASFFFLSASSFLALASSFAFRFFSSSTAFFSSSSYFFFSASSLFFSAADCCFSSSFLDSSGLAALLELKAFLPALAAVGVLSADLTEASPGAGLTFSAGLVTGRLPPLPPALVVGGLTLVLVSSTYCFICCSKSCVDFSLMSFSTASRCSGVKPLNTGSSKVTFGA